MKKYVLFIASLLGGSSIAFSQSEGLTLKDITSGAYSPDAVYGMRPTKQGEYYTQLSDDHRQIIRRSFKTGEIVEILFDCATAQGEANLQAIDGYELSPDESKILIRTQTRSIYRRSYTAVHYIYDVASKTYAPLSDKGAQQVPLFSPNGEMVAFVRKNNLFVYHLGSKVEWQVTDDGQFNEVINGIPDWVYEEEFSLNRSFDFSSDSRSLAWVRYDESKVPIYSMQEFKGLQPERRQYDEYPGAFQYKYPVAGAQNSTVSVHAFDLSQKRVQKIAVPLATDGYIPRIYFTSDANKLAVVTLNRRQDEMNIYMANPHTGVAKLVLQEKANKYIKETAYGSLKFYPGHFAFLSDRSGYNQAYLYTLDGKLVRQLTQGNEVSRFYGYEPKSGQSYYAAFDGSPLRQAVFVANAKGKAKKLSAKTGMNTATFSTDFSYFLNVYSSMTQPPVTTLNNKAGQALVTLVDNKGLAEKVADKVGRKELFSFTTSEGVTLNGWMIKPKGFDATKRYPVIMYQYSGPGSQEVTDSWYIGSYGGGLFESYMAQQGFIYVCVDGRGTGGRGSDFEKCTYLRLGELEAKDQVETAIYLGTLPYVDKERIGIWGWSFGGFNTLMAMSEGRPVFSAGVAVAAPTNWKYYDTVYTERYMRTPQDNTAGYAINPIERAPKLHGQLLLIHGTADDNVHFRNFVEVAEAYVQANKQIDHQVYTNRNHGIYGGNTRYHLFTKISNFFVEHLKNKQ